MTTNNFKPFGIGSGANVTSQEDYEALAALTSGFQSGKASSAQINKAIRQATVMSHVLAQYISDSAGVDVLDNGIPDTILENFKSGVLAASTGRLLNVKTFTSSGTYTPTAGTKSIRVKAIAGGGGGGGCPATSSSQTGGSQAGFYGQYIDVIIPISALAASVSVVIGAGGAGGVAGANAGSAGGNTSFGSIFTLGGGTGGGAGGVGSSSIVVGAGVVTGKTLTSTITPLNSSGGTASSQQFVQVTAGTALGFTSVPSPIEGGYRGRGGEGKYLDASSSATAGSAGKDGIIIIEEYA